MRNMSFMLTVGAFRERRKTVTRRNGWRFLRAGDLVMGCEKCQGLKKGEKIVRMGAIRVLDERWERLDLLINSPEYGRQEVANEGFPDMTPQEFVDMYCKHNKCRPEELVHRIAFEYV